MIRAWVGTFTINIIIVLCGLITGVLTARLLLPEGRGALAAVLFWPQLISGLGLLSLDQSITYRIGSSKSGYSEIVATGFWISIFLSLFVTILGYLFIPYLLGSERKEIWELARYYLLLFIPAAFTTLSLNSVDQGRLRFVTYNLLRVSVPILYLVGLIVIWVWGKVTVSTVVWINITATVIVAVSRIILSKQFIKFVFYISEAKNILKNAIGFHVTAIVIIVSTQADKFVILQEWDNATLGIYMVAFTFATSGINIVSNSYHIVLFPLLANSDSNKKIELLTKGISRSMT